MISVQPPTPVVAATVVQCVTASAQSARSATFEGEMTAIPGTERMVVRIDLLQRQRGEAFFQRISAPGLGVWRQSEKKVKVYKSLQQVTNLTAPDVFRASISFRWLDDKGKIIKRTTRLTPRCDEPVLKPPPPPSEATSSPGDVAASGSEAPAT